MGLKKTTFISMRESNLDCPWGHPTYREEFRLANRRTRNTCNAMGIGQQLIEECLLAVVFSFDIDD